MKKFFLRVINLFRDSPTYGRDRANLISGFTIGTTALLLNAAVMMLVLPLMLDPDDRDFREITENVEFGQLLAMILLGGATAFATLLIPLRLVTVFWGPRIGRYFDQIVLSGISPLRFVIGKATSQNLFLGLIGFLLLPWLVLSLTLGGVDFSYFVSGLFLVWLYCMALALVTLWATLYLNELLAAFVVIGGAGFLGGLGCIPMPMQPFVVTPMPALIHPLYKSIPFFDGRIPPDFAPIFISCVASLSAIICVAIFAIYLGPLFGIIQENSTFGEVVRAGDTKKKRWFRLRLHIQRPSEIAFFYENRSQTFRRQEAFIRWGLGLAGLVLLAGTAYSTFAYLIATYVVIPGGPPMRWWIYEFHTIYLAFHGIGIALAVFLFSHSKNSTFLRLPVFRGKTVQIATLDTVAFILFVLISISASIGVPFAFEEYVVKPTGATLYPPFMYGTEGEEMNYLRVTYEATAIIACAGLLVYALHRIICLFMWVRTAAFAVTAGLYLGAICLAPVMVAMFCLEMRELRDVQFLQVWAPKLAAVSPVASVLSLFHEMPGRIRDQFSTVPFCIVHGGMLCVAVLLILRKSKAVKEQYLVPPSETQNVREEQS